MHFPIFTFYWLPIIPEKKINTTHSNFLLIIIKCVITDYDCSVIDQRSRNQFPSTYLCWKREWNSFMFRTSSERPAENNHTLSQIVTEVFQFECALCSQIYDALFSRIICWPHCIPAQTHWARWTLNLIDEWPNP